MEVRRTFDLLDRYAEKFVIEDAFAIKRNKKWELFSTKDYIDNSHYFAYGLMEMGYKVGDKIATVSNNRPEWNFIDMGLSLGGFIHVPIYPTISESEYAHIFADSGVKMLILSDKLLLKKLSPLAEEATTIREIFTINTIEGEKNYGEILALGKKTEPKHKEALLKHKESISSKDLVTIIYTSGTTGNSKGVMLSHQNLVSNFIATAPVQPMEFGAKVLSFLPLCHVYERMMNYHFQYKGLRIYYAENMGTIADNLKEIKADGFNTVPRLLEKVYDKIVAKGKDLSGIKKVIFFWAVNLGLRYELNGENGWLYEQKLKLARKLVFDKWNEALGGNISTIVSGGSALQPRLARVFHAAGMKVMEGYGLTETGPVIAVNNAYYPNIKFGTVGPVIDGVEVRIAEDGEILCKGPNVMMGYYNAPDLTAEVIDEDGWFHTGDIGVLEDDKFLKITDRKKEIFKLSSGKYVAPQAVENKFKESIFIEQIMVVGENEKFASALVSPNFNHLHFWASKHKVHYRDNMELVRKPEVVARFQKEVNIVNKKLSLTENVKRFRIVCDEWSPNTRELSPTLKLKRKNIYEKYDHILREIYRYSNGNGD
ncbi:MULTISPECIES: long-chain fatty acid--CoA ligase [unclassified Lentimicrobium]|uniref:AMP-dependent synthetase/ligase n=1 Tax=unclassified Lentimicrobium TaxID=2677434 RepID=UPI001551D9AB|nr:MULTISPECIES: AMP-dependent synthetase/ligase [unclassified Lentimicrobium]NPD45836.1 long-chain fatty acid--CoA ligase [Lentimicrobium sp. S6]NPD85799.1 long-chain fatty acid--CoA ligase [Lentimicrobium sp. L6]